MRVEDSFNSSAQVVPNPPGHSFSGSNYSYSSQPIQMRTFAPNNYGMSTSPSNDFLKKSQCHDDQKHVEEQREMPVKERPRVMNPVDSFPKLVTPQSQIGANYIRKYYNGHNRHGYNSDSETDDEAGGQYSCADMSEAIHPRHVLETIPDDAESTTTSGSYVVDPNDLCEEIDELFFRDLVV